jgi:hypothetical protein
LREREVVPKETVLAPGILIRAVHIVDMRQALQEAYDQLGWPRPIYTTSPGVGAIVRAEDLAQLRAALVGLE